MAERTRHALVVDPTTGQPLVFGGFQQNSWVGDWIWAWNGTRWNAIEQTPPAANVLEVIHDPVRDVFVACLDGGFTLGSGILTAEWDRQSWAALPNVPMASGTSRDTDLFWDPVRGRPTILAVDLRGTTELWELVGSSWVNRWTGPAGPPWGGGRAVVEPGSGRLTYVVRAAATQAMETWTFQAGTWQQVATATVPTSLASFELAIDPTSGDVMLFGGAASIGGFAVAQNEHWVFDGTDWSLMTSATSAPPRYGFGMHVDGGRVLVHGGVGSSGLLDDLWAWDGAQGTWTELAANVGLPVAFEGTFAYDPAKAELVAWSWAPEAGTWRYGSTGWRFDPAGPSAPDPRATLAFDPVDRSIVAVATNGTWRHESGAWTQFLTAAQTPTTVGVRLVSDGQGLLIVSASGTFQLGAQGWTQLAGPGPIGQAVERPGGGVLLASGSSIYEWTGSGWAVRVSVPVQRSGYVFCTDLARGRVLYGEGDTWEWTGQRWTLAQTSGMPSPLRAVVDTGFGGEAWFVISRSLPGSGPTRIYRWRSATPAEWDPARGAGCPGSSGTPTLSADPSGLPWIGQQMSVRLDAPGGATAGLVVLGFGRTAWNGQALPLDLQRFGAPGCTLQLEPAEVLAIAAPLPSASQWSLAIPSSAPLVGLEFFLQGLVLDPAANRGGFVVSGSVRGTVGRR